MRAAAIFGLALAGLAAALSPARADDACAGFKWPVERERAALSAPDRPVLATGAAYPGLGQGVTLTLVPQADVAYAAKPTRAPKSAPAYGGQLVVPDATGGAVQVTLSDDAWVDLVQDGKVLRSTGFSGKTGCSGVRKSVRFAPAPGPVTISISDSAVPAIRLVMTPAE